MALSPIPTNSIDASEVVRELSITHSPSRSLVTQLGVVGFVAGVVIAASSALRGWPFSNMTSEPWLFQLESSNMPLRWACTLIFYVGVAAVCWAWLRTLKAAKRNEISLRSAIGLFVVWTIPLFLAVPLFSGDVFVYYVDGQALARGYSPYEAGVNVLGPTPMVHMVHPVWRDTTTMYGPVFMRMAEGIAHITDGSVVAGVLLFRAVSVVSVVIAAASVVSMCRSLKLDALVAFVFAILNPVTMLHLIGGAHNDATMIGLMMAGLAVGLKAHSANSWPLRLLAIGLCVFGAAFKVPALAAVFILGWIWAGQPAKRWFLEKAKWCAISGAIGIAFLHVLGVITNLGWGWTRATDVPGIAHPMLAPANAFAFAIGGPFGISDDVSSWTRPIAFGISVLLAAWLVLRCGASSPPERVLRAGGWALLGIAWLGPAVYPWYLVWGVILLGVVGAGQLSKALTIMTVAVILAISPGGYGWFDGWNDWRRTLSAVAVSALVIWTSAHVVRTSQTWDRFLLTVNKLITLVRVNRSRRDRGTSVVVPEV